MGREVLKRGQRDGTIKVWRKRRAQKTHTSDKEGKCKSAGRSGIGQLPRKPFAYASLSPSLSYVFASMLFTPDSRSASFLISAQLAQ